MSTTNDPSAMPRVQPLPMRTAINPLLLKLGMLLPLLVLLIIPSYLVATLIDERQGRQADVVNDFDRGWGPEQTLYGEPILLVPYATAAGAPDHFLHVTPKQLGLAVHLTPDLRRKGMFGAVVYTADITMKGSFATPQGGWPTGLLWEHASLFLLGSNLRSAGDATLTWDGKPAEWVTCQQDSCSDARYLTAALGLSEPPATAAFEAHLQLRGTHGFWAQPGGRHWQMELSGAWATPGFGGGVLPDGSTVTDKDFTAHWSTPSSVAAGQVSWTSNRPYQINARGSEPGIEQRVGVELLEAVPAYHMIERANKYGLFFLVLAFTTYFLFEALARVAINIVQYALLGLSIALFALLLISFAEPFGFTLGYAISAMLVLAQATFHTAAVTRRAGQTAIFAGMLTLLFAFNYVALSRESYSLLLGSLALFIVLTVVMAVTRNIDWSTARPASVGPIG